MSVGSVAQRSHPAGTLACLDCDPRAGRSGDLAEDGVSPASVAAKLGVSRPAARTHLDLLTGMGLLRAKKIRRRTFYRRDEGRIAQVKQMFEHGW